MLNSEEMNEVTLLTRNEQQEFASVFATIVLDAANHPEINSMPETSRWLSHVLKYNVPHGKQNRAFALILAYKHLAKEVSSENMHLAYKLAWIVETFQALLTIADDIMDCSETRRRKPCWHRVDNLGVKAWRDVILVESTIYYLLKKYFAKKNYYAGIIELFRRTTLQTTYGQSLDNLAGLQMDLNSFTPDLYAKIVKYKTSFYTFYFPVALAMTMVGVADNVLMEAKCILVEMGHFFQVQDDYMDVFGDVSVTGKIGTDIQYGKCTWVIVTALRNADATTRAILQENYGKQDPQKVQNCKRQFEQLEIPKIYQAYEAQTYNSIRGNIETISPALPKQLFLNMLRKIYQRSS